MKLKNIKTARKTPGKKNSVGFSLPDISLNVIIILLGIIILYMSYSIVNKIINRNSEDLISAMQKPSDIIQLEVLNGCGVSGTGDKFTEYLRNNKFDVVNVSNYISFDVDKTIVIDRTGNIENARKVASTLGINPANVVQQINHDYFLDVSLIIGKDYNQLKPYK